MSFAQQNVTDLERANDLYDNHQEKQALNLYLSILENNPQNYISLWRSSLLYSRIGNHFEDKDDQEQYYNKAIDLAERALEVDSTDTHSNYVMAVARGRKALIAGAQDRVAASRAIKKYADRAVQADSSNAGAWHVMGRWHFKVANLSWIERTAANTLFGGIPGDASNEQAAKYITKAIELNANYLLYYYDLATVYKELGKDQKAINTCIKGLQKPEVLPGDDQIKQECQQLIQDLR